MSLAIKMYSQDYDEICPFGDSGSLFWHAAIFPYTHNNQILRCPDRKERYVGYGMNWLASGMSEGSFFDPASKILIADVPPECLGVTNSDPGAEWWINDPGNDICGAIIRDGVTPSVAGSELPERNSFTDIGRPQRHNDGLVWGYADGHAKWAREEALDQPVFWDPATTTE